MSPKDLNSGNDSSPTLMKPDDGYSNASKASELSLESVIDQVVQGDDKSPHNSVRS